LVVAGGLGIFLWMVVPAIEAALMLLDSTPKRREARITRRITDARGEISGILAIAKEAMDRRASRDNSFRLGGWDKW
jgi:hypothetical protein